MNIFERAARAKLRFDSPVGDLTVENLFDLPLMHTNPNKANLDDIARGVARELREIGEGSFVMVKPDPRKADLELRLEIVKHVIESAQAARTAAENRKANEQRKQKLMDALAAKDDQALAGMSREDIQAEINKLGEAA
jgi:hypothetical protein